MADRTLDRIHIRDLDLPCIVGVYPHERRDPQPVRLNITLHADLRRPCITDELADTVDYKALRDEVAALVAGSSFLLIERLAEAVAQVCLTHEGVRRVRVRVDKPEALQGTRSVGVEIVRPPPDPA